MRVVTMATAVENYRSVEALTIFRCTSLYWNYPKVRACWSKLLGHRRVVSLHTWRGKCILLAARADKLLTYRHSSLDEFTMF